MTAPVTIWWVRHGPTHQKSFCGWRDVDADLSDTGLIDRLDAGLPAHAPVGSSDLRRAMQTADAIAGARSRLDPMPQIREFNFGQWDGLGFDEVAARDPETSRLYWETPGDVAPPGGESWNQLEMRVSGAVADLQGAFSGPDVILVAHIGVILTQVAKARGQAPARAIAQPIRPLSVSQITYDGDQATPGPIDQLY